eukprot:1178851-Prorocentrum_minimum.AAC.3
MRLHFEPHRRLHFEPHRRLRFEPHMRLHFEPHRKLGEDSAYSRQLSPLVGWVHTIFRLFPVKHVYDYASKRWRSDSARLVSSLFTRFELRACLGLTRAGKRAAATSSAGSSLWATTLTTSPPRSSDMRITRHLLRPRQVPTAFTAGSSART